MREQTQEDLHKIWNCQDDLRGCINRMCVTHEQKELGNMYYYAIQRLSDIYDVNYKRLTEGDKQ